MWASWGKFAIGVPQMNKGEGEGMNGIKDKGHSHEQAG